MHTANHANPELHGDSSLTSIVLVTHNELEYTKLCFESIDRWTTEPYELIVVDNGSTDGTVEWCKGLGSRIERAGEQTGPGRVTVISNPANWGFPTAANQGIRAASGSQILLLNNDTVVTARWLTRMLIALYSDPQIGIVGPVSNFVSGPQQVAVTYEQRTPKVEGGVETNGLVMKIDGRPGGTVFCDLSMLDGFARKWGETNGGRIVEVERLVGFCVLIRRELIDRVGLLDERFGVGNFEDDDYCRRAREAGFRLAIATDSFVHHFGGRTFIGSGVDHGALMRRNERLYREKWDQSTHRTCDRSPLIGAQQIGITNQQITISPDRECRTPTLDDPRPLISLCMIARNNERTIAAAIEGIRPHVDEMIVVDTGSTDRTAEIAASLGAKVFHFHWCDDFSAARNQSIRHAHGLWIFWMDTDDVIDEENARKIRDLVLALRSSAHSAVHSSLPTDSTAEIAEQRGGPPVLGYLMRVRCPSVGENGDGGYIEVDQVKLFRNLPAIRFEGRIHEQVLMAIRRAGGTVTWTDLFVVHANADNSPEGRAKKIERDLRILQIDHQERPDHPFVLFNLGMTLAEAGRHEEAIGFLWQSIGRAGDDDSHLRKTYALLVSSYRQLGRHVAAWETCLKGLKQFHDDPELRFRQATMLRDFGNLPDAARAFEDLLAHEAALSSDPEQPLTPALSPNGRGSKVRHLSSVDRGIKGYRARQNLAAVYTDMGDFAKAEQQWRRVIDEVPKNPAAWRGLGDVLIRQGRYDDAVALADHMQTNTALARDARLLRVEVLVARGDTAGAHTELEASLRKHPDDSLLIERRCRLLFEHFSPVDAEPAFRALVEHDPDNASAHHNLGSILYKLGRYNEAAAAYRESLRLRPNSASTYLHLGYALREAGNLAETTAAWEEALKLAPNDPAVTEALEQARARSTG